MISIKKANLLSIFRYVKRTFIAFFLKLRYRVVIFRLRKVYGKRKLIIAFGVSDISKWKCQSLYEEFEQKKDYYPIIFVYPTPQECRLSSKEQEVFLERKIIFFEEKNMNVINIWDSIKKKSLIPSSFKPDIVFYQQPWDVPPFPTPLEFSNRALTFYVPYYLMNNFDKSIELDWQLHHQIYGYIVLNEDAATFFESKKTKCLYAGKCIGLGHTIVDKLVLKPLPTKEKYVIYAPHFSFPFEGKNRLLTYSSFLENGKLILEFAKKHPEFKWVFKPHPVLYTELKTTGVWSSSEIDSYYGEWKNIGVLCDTSDYIEYFQNSIAMITDCGSFLTEYSCMDKPLIRLYYHKENLPPNPILEKLYSTFYYAHNNTELIDLLTDVLCKHNDPNKDVRHEEIIRLGLTHSNASRKIVEYMDSLLYSK